MTAPAPYGSPVADAFTPFIVAFLSAHSAAGKMERTKDTMNEWQQNNHRLFAIIRDNQAVGFMRIHKTSPIVY